MRAAFQQVELVVLLDRLLAEVLGWLVISRGLVSLVKVVSLLLFGVCFLQFAFGLPLLLTHGGLARLPLPKLTI